MLEVNIILFDIMLLFLVIYYNDKQTVTPSTRRTEESVQCAKVNIFIHRSKCTVRATRSQKEGQVDDYFTTTTVHDGSGGKMLTSLYSKPCSQMFPSVTHTGKHWETFAKCPQVLAYIWAIYFRKAASFWIRNNWSLMVLCNDCLAVQCHDYNPRLAPWCSRDRRSQYLAL